MKNSNKQDRWYDKNQNLLEALEIIKQLPEDARANIASVFADFVKLVRQNKEQNEVDTELKSLGKKRVLGLYKAQNNQRWYDNDKSVQKIMKLVDTLDEEDFELIAEGFLKTLKDAVNIGND